VKPSGCASAASKWAGRIRCLRDEVGRALICGGVGSMRRADIDEGTKSGTTSQESAELREARRRIKLLEQENEVLRRAAAYLSQAHLPGKGSTRS